MLSADWQLARHGLKWIDYKDFSYEQEAEHIDRAVDIHQQITGRKPRGFYQGRTGEHTLRIIADRGDFDYHADSYSDDLPYWDDRFTAEGQAQLMVPYTLDVNDMRFASPQGFNSGEQFYQYLKDSFDCLYAEGEQSPKMLSIGLHCRLSGRPGRFMALQRFIDYAQSHSQVWFARRIEIAEHWQKNHPYQTNS
jgi:urate oxidase